MYTVTCPSCGFAIELPFARRGAAGRCPACKKVVPVDDATLRVGNAQPSAAAAPSPQIAPETPDLDPEGNVVGLSGLSNLLERTAGRRGTTPKPPAAPARRPTASPPPAMPRHALLIVVVAVATVGLLGLAIWYITLPNRRVATPPPITAPDAAPPVEPDVSDGGDALLD
ncbi:MAG: hypothetical protein AAGI54_05820 [Planctomycetota bacterium]